ncbi:hypothetical protein ACJRO7_005571 [Eucalyptus globulus]|uniref:NB-ARC domain-containing protein n=1 Tax=Eucalyptus globulus TaxID=34317 RepID=A0ABD3J005_EUCGL
MADPEVGTSPLNAERSIEASSPSEPPQARKMKDESHVVGRDDFANKLVSQLIDKKGDHANLRVISVVGEGAIGKTALVRSVYNRADIKNHFDRCAWVRVGPKPKLVHLMADLLKQLMVPGLRDVDYKDKEKLSEEVLRVLMGHCYLIVLDDLCDLHLMDKLIINVFADSRNGSRVIVTTCNPDIPSSIDPWFFKPLTLSPLDREQSEKLLGKCHPAFHAVDPPEELLRLKEMILSKSGGSPPKILLLGGLLSATTSDRCTELANLLTIGLTNGLPDGPTLHDVVRLGVDDLPKGLKQCALYLTLFPKESDIPTRRLFRLWSAENLVSSASNGAEKCFEILCRRGTQSLLRVLDLEGVYKPSLPEELGNILPKLKYLGLRWTLLERLPKSVGLLSRLETLDLKYTNISDLPDSIREAENLRHLYMTEVNLDSKKSLNCNIQTIWGLCVGAGSDMLEELGKFDRSQEAGSNVDGQRGTRSNQAYFESGDASISPIAIEGSIQLAFIWLRIE